MQIKLHGKYGARNGAVVTIVDHTPEDLVYPYRASDGHVYTSTGRWYSDGQESSHDLMVDLTAPNKIPDPIMQANAALGRKDDSNKLDLTLLFDDCPHALEAVAEVLQWAITKKQPKPYERGSWQHVEDFQRRYRAAMLRHTLGAAKSHMGGNGGATVGGIEAQRDKETGLLELAHIATDAIFQLEMAIRKEKGI
jgi:Domain of unknown function (DUF5664)